MAISSDYPKPVTVNGFVCRNCDDVSKAKRNIDPAEIAGGPPKSSEAVSFGGELASLRQIPQVFDTQATQNRLDRYA